MKSSEIKVGGTYIGGKYRTKRKVLAAMGENSLQYHELGTGRQVVIELKSFAYWAKERVTP